MHCCQMFLYMGRVVDKFETKGRTFVRTFIPGAGRFYGAGKELLPVICIDTDYHECVGTLWKRNSQTLYAWPFVGKPMVVRLVIITSSNIIVSLPERFRKLSLSEIFTVPCIAQIGIFPIRFQLISKSFNSRIVWSRC